MCFYYHNGVHLLICVQYVPTRDSYRDDSKPHRNGCQDSRFSFVFELHFWNTATDLFLRKRFQPNNTAVINPTWLLNC